MIADRTSQTITLADGRKLGFAEWGDPNGKPVLLFGGANGRFLRPPDDTIAHSLGSRLLTVERPGFGLSDHKPERRVIDWADDVRQLADALGFERFTVIGASQGGPFAMAVAYALPERVTSLTLVSAVAPQDVPELRNSNPSHIRTMLTLAERAPFLLSALTGLIGIMGKRSPEGMYRQLLKNLPPVDQAIMSTPEAQAIFLQDTPEALRHGGKGSAADVRAIILPWGFHPKDIRVKTYIWQGEDDPNVKPIMARWLVEHIPNSELTMVAGQGHFLIYVKWREILAQAIA